jgi:tetratricopeptide (TPR) repeat protein
MRMSPALLVAAVTLGCLSSAAVIAPASAQSSDAGSVRLQAEGERLAAAGQLNEAIGYFEAALVADPRNANAYIGLGRIAVTQALPGKAIGYFREALALQPENRAALAGQGAAYVARGAVDRARANLARLQTLCGSDACAEARELTVAINASGSRTALRPSEVAPNPVVEPAAPATN